MARLRRKFHGASLPLSSQGPGPLVLAWLLLTACGGCAQTTSLSHKVKTSLAGESSYVIRRTQFLAYVLPQGTMAAAAVWHDGMHGWSVGVAEEGKMT